MPNNTFVLDDGTKEIRLENTYGEEICTIHIRTGELGIVDRYNAFMRRLGDVIEPLSSIELNDDGSAHFTADWAILKKVESDVISCINEVFDFKEADKIFATHNAFSSVGGEFFVEKVLVVLGQIIESGVKEEAKKTQKRVGKYLKDIKRVDGDDRTTANHA